jgi:hypothetical protein
MASILTGHNCAMAIRMPSGDLYAELGVAPDASAADISAAFRVLARALHPDTNPDPAAVERFKVLSAAYRVLGDAGERARYDRQRRARAAPGLPVPPSADATATAPATAPATPVPAGRATPVPSLFGWQMTRKRAGWILGAGIACVVLACAVTAWVVTDPASGSDSGRTITLAIVAVKLLVGGAVAIVLGSRRLARTIR